jgi:hypothetical protein
MITDKQFEEFVRFIDKLRFEGNEVYIHGRKVVKTEIAQDKGREFNWSNTETKIWTKNPGETSYVSYTKASINNGTKLHRLYDAVQTIRNDYTYMQAKLALKKYEEKYGSENRGDGNTVGNDQVPAGTG